MKKYLRWFTPVRITIIAAIIVAVLVVGFLLRGWIRGSLIPDIVSARYADGLQATLEDERQGLGGTQLFGNLGMWNSRESPAKCVLETASLFKTTVYCWVAQYNMRKFSDAQDLATFKLQFKALHRKLMDNGWHGGRQTNMDAPPAIMTLPIGWYSYYKTIDGKACTLQLNDHGGILRGELYCSRKYEIL